MTVSSDYVDYLKSVLGANYVVARRSRRLAARYGEDASFVTHAQLNAATRDYRMAHGREYDAPRAAMYLALKQIHAHLANGDNCPAIMQELARAAITAEQSTFGAP